MNNKGFMMAEVIITASIILVALAGLFSGFNKIYTEYMKRISYYDTVTLCRLGYYRDILIENNKINELLERTNTVSDIYNSGGFQMFTLPQAEVPNNEEDRVLLVKNGKNTINKNILKDKNITIHNTFLDYIDYLSTSVKPQSNYVLVMERCNIKNGRDNINIDDCKYAYLEVYDGKE